MPNALLVYPEHPPTYWGADHVLEMTGVKATHPPLGLLTIAAMFPASYELRVVDMNVSALLDADLEWADLVFTSTMITQHVSLRAVVERCNRAGVPVVAGGPHPTTFHEEIGGVAHFVLDEVEETFAEFLRDLESGTARRVYRETRKPDVTRTPVPRFDLIDIENYATMAVQFSRGCPFDCEFCDIIKLYGRVPRTKSPEQVVEELDSLYRLGWRGPVFLVDDNFIGNKRDALKLLPAIAGWQKARGYPFALNTEASANLALMDAMMDAMIEAGFDTVFVGIETPNPEALLKTKKQQNTSKTQDKFLYNAVRKIQRHGMQVQGGFILGLDSDDEGVFDAQIEFIQETGIPVAHIYLLTALKGTDMYERMKSEDRLLEAPLGTNAMPLNFRTELDYATLIEGYKRVIATLYDPTLENYFSRCLTLFRHLTPVRHLRKRKSRTEIDAAFMGVRRRLSASQVPAYSKFIGKVSKNYPHMLPVAIYLAAIGYHFEKITRQQIAIHDFLGFLRNELETFQEAVSGRVSEEELRTRSQTSLERAQSLYRSIPDEFRYQEDGLADALKSFRRAVAAQTDGFAHVAPVS
ncbi:MAG: radical SAM protein [Defluviicoccus sp.]|nr:radical SAM protein [Defluviicoccus sp.]MDE0274661.1 radical SAM protein [Defluviicoccus sp.]